MASNFFCNFEQKKKKKIHQRWFPIFLQLQAKKIKTINVGFLFFATSSNKKKKNPYVLGILIIGQHWFTLKKNFKIVLSIFIPKILPII